MPTTKYIWDEDNLLAEADGTNTINTVYTNEPQQFGNLISTRIAGTTSYHHFDALGSTRQLTNSAGTVTDAMTYDAWGNVVGRTRSTAITALWAGQFGYQFDSEIGLFCVRRRPYDPPAGRWTTIDPLEMSLTGYIYVSNRPTNVLDPSGLKDWQQNFCCGYVNKRGKKRFRSMGAPFQNANEMPAAALITCNMGIEGSESVICAYPIGKNDECKSESPPTKPQSPALPPAVGPTRNIAEGDTVNVVIVRWPNGAKKCFVECRKPPKYQMEYDCTSAGQQDAISHMNAVCQGWAPPPPMPNFPGYGTEDLSEELLIRCAAQEYPIYRLAIIAASIELARCIFKESLGETPVGAIACFKPFSAACLGAYVLYLKRVELCLLKAGTQGMPTTIPTPSGPK
jgi:RHS repeat-associated protein